MDIKTQELLIHSMVREINRTVREDWTSKELFYGKEIVFPWAEIDTVKQVIPLFVEKGWIIKKKQALFESTGRKLVVHICKPPFDEN